MIRVDECRFGLISCEGYDSAPHVMDVDCIELRWNDWGVMPKASDLVPPHLETVGKNYLGCKTYVRPVLIILVEDPPDDCDSQFRTPVFRLKRALSFGCLLDRTLRGGSRWCWTD